MAKPTMTAAEYLQTQAQLKIPRTAMQPAPTNPLPHPAPANRKSERIVLRCPECGSPLNSEGDYVWCSYIGGLDRDGRQTPGCDFGLRGRPVRTDEIAAGWRQLNPFSGLTVGEQAVSESLCAAWNAFVGLLDREDDETTDFRRAIHEAQRILQARAHARAYPNYWHLPDSLSNS